MNAVKIPGKLNQFLYKAIEAIDDEDWTMTILPPNEFYIAVERLEAGACSRGWDGILFVRLDKKRFLTITHNDLTGLLAYPLGVIKHFPTFSSRKVVERLKQMLGADPKLQAKLVPDDWDFVADIRLEADRSHPSKMEKYK